MHHTFVTCGCTESYFQVAHYVLWHIDHLNNGGYCTVPPALLVISEHDALSPTFHLCVSYLVRRIDGEYFLKHYLTHRTSDVFSVKYVLYLYIKFTGIPGSGG